MWSAACETLQASGDRKAGPRSASAEQAGDRARGPRAGDEDAVAGQEIADARRALFVSVATTLLAMFAFGLIEGRLTGIPPLRGAIQTALIGGLAAAAAFAIARAIDSGAKARPCDVKVKSQSPRIRATSALGGSLRHQSVWEW